MANHAKECSPELKALREKQRQLVDKWMTKTQEGIAKMNSGASESQEDEEDETILPLDQVKMPSIQLLVRIERDISVIERIAADLIALRGI